MESREVAQMLWKHYHGMAMDMGKQWGFIPRRDKDLLRLIEQEYGYIKPVIREFLGM